MKDKIVLVSLLIFLATVAVFFVTSRQTIPLVSPIKPVVKQDLSQSSSMPSTPSYNPPQEIKYGSSTDLKQELDSINPQVLDSDFE